MKTYSERKQTLPTAKPRFTVPENNSSTRPWIPLVSLTVAGLICYLAYALCSNIPAVSLSSTGTWQLFG